MSETMGLELKPALDTRRSPQIRTASWFRPASRADKSPARAQITEIIINIGPIPYDVNKSPTREQIYHQPTMPVATRFNSMMQRSSLFPDLQTLSPEERARDDRSVADHELDWSHVVPTPSRPCKSPSSSCCVVPLN